MNYLVASANGYGNVGDDICGFGAKYLIKQIDPKAKVTVTAPPFNGELAAQADVIVLGGGGIFYDGDRANVDNYLAYLEYAQQHNKPNAVLGVGVQGIGTEWGKGRYREVLNKCDLVTVRSPRDKQLLDEIGVKNVHATQDLGFVADEWVRRPRLQAFGRFVKKLTGQKPQLGLAVVDLKVIKGNAFDATSANFMDSLERNLDNICKTFDVKLLVHSRDDENWYSQLAKHQGVKVVPYGTIRDFPGFWKTYCGLDLVLGVRFHSIILGLLSGRPVIGVSSKGTKQDRLAQYDMPTLKEQLVHFSDVEGIKNLFDNLPQDYLAGKYKPATAEEMAHTKSLAHQNGRLLADVLSKQRQ